MNSIGEEKRREEGGNEILFCFLGWFMVRSVSVCNLILVAEDSWLGGVETPCNLFVSTAAAASAAAIVISPR